MSASVEEQNGPAYNTSMLLLKISMIFYLSETNKYERQKCTSIYRIYATLKCLITTNNNKVSPLLFAFNFHYSS